MHEVFWRDSSSGKIRWIVGTADMMKGQLAVGIVLQLQDGVNPVLHKSWKGLRCSEPVQNTRGAIEDPVACEG